MTGHFPTTAETEMQATGLLVDPATQTTGVSHRQTPGSVARRIGFRNRRASGETNGVIPAHGRVSERDPPAGVPVHDRFCRRHPVCLWWCRRTDEDCPETIKRADVLQVRWILPCTPDYPEN